MKTLSYIKTSLIACGLVLSFLASPAAGFSATNKDKAIASASTTATDQAYKNIDAKELKSWIDSGKKIELIDARPKKFESDNVIVGARFLAYDSDEKAIAKSLPNKDAIIVTYCASEKCPASKYLSEQLVKLGYTHVYKYPGGIADWIEHSYPTGKAKK